MTIALIPVVSSTGTPLMPCHPARARKLVSRGKAILRHRKGFLYLQLLYRADGEVQEVAVGVDPGSKMEAVTVLSAKHTFLNLQFNARDGKCILGGHSDKSGYSLHSVLSHTRLTQTAKASDLQLIAHSPWVLIPAHLPLPYKERKVRRKQASPHLHHLL